MTRDLKSNIAVVQLLDPQSINDTDTKSKLLDTLTVESSAVSVLMGTFTGVDSDSTLLPVLQESNTTADADFTAVAAADIQGAFTTVNSTSLDNTNQTVGYIGQKRYIRVLIDFTTGTGGISAALVSVVGLLGKTHYAPVTAPSPVAAT